MAFRKFAAHYALLPDGSWGKWPVVEMDEQGMLVSVTVNPQGFREQPSLQYYGGVLLPGFVDAWGGFSDSMHDQKALNQHMVKGTLVLGSTLDEMLLKTCTTPPFLIKQQQPDESLSRQIVSAPVVYQYGTAS